MWAESPLWSIPGAVFPLPPLSPKPSPGDSPAAPTDIPQLPLPPYIPLCCSGPRGCSAPGARELRGAGGLIPQRPVLPPYIPRAVPGRSCRDTDPGQGTGPAGPQSRGLEQDRPRQSRRRQEPGSLSWHRAARSRHGNCCPLKSEYMESQRQG